MLTLHKFFKFSCWSWFGRGTGNHIASTRKLLWVKAPAKSMQRAGFVYVESLSHLRPAEAFEYYGAIICFHTCTAVLKFLTDIQERRHVKTQMSAISQLQINCRDFLSATWWHLWEDGERDSLWVLQLILHTFCRRWGCVWIRVNTSDFFSWSVYYLLFPY